MARRLVLPLLAVALVAAAAPAGAGARGTACAGTRAHRTVPAIRSFDVRHGSIRVFATQLKQDARWVVSYASFRRKVDCMLRADVLPWRARGRPNVVAFNEDVGLATLATGSRGAAARRIVARPGAYAPCRGQGFPCRTVALLTSLGDAYRRALDYYRAHLPGLGDVSGVFVAGTDTYARGWMATFSALARRYGLYILGSSDQAPFRETRDPAAIAALRDPDLPRPRSVFVATSPHVYNEVFLWGPRDVRRSGPPMLRNVVASNRKVPLTDIENALGLTPGPASGPAAVANLRPYRVPGSRARLGFATSLPAFQFGVLAPGADPCSNTAVYYMRCLSRLGANVVVQDEANPGPWANERATGIWQPLDWMGSTWRSVADPGVRFDYNVTPMLVGNLGDLVFDGQSAITQRGLRRGRGCHYIGDARFDPADGDPASEAGYAGAKTQFLALAPWVTRDAPRAALRATAKRLAPASGDRLENDYVETALAADLTFPPDPRRRGCVGAGGR